MPQIAKPGDKEAARRADEALFKKHPERKSKPITSLAEDAALRAEWLAL